MSGQWDGGKGDKSRVSNFNAYQNSPFWEKKEKQMSYKQRNLFLDDVRMPKEATLWGEDPPVNLITKSGIFQSEWEIVRSYDEFVAWIDKNGIPDVVSFDNDLFDVTNHKYDSGYLSKQFTMENWQEFTLKTGAHCAEYLVKAVKARKAQMPKYYIHTANSAARPIIRQILSNK